MISKYQKKALTVIHDRLQRTDIVWTITGSLGFALHEMIVKVNDIDIQTDASSVYEIEKIFTKCIVNKVEFSVSGNIIVESKNMSK